jgi:anti-sigma factor RsiW
MNVPFHPSEEDLIAYSGGDLPPPAAATVASHLEACAACRSEVAVWRTLRRRTGAYFHEQVDQTPLPADAWNRMQLAMAHPDGRSNPWTPQLLLRPLTTLAIAAVLLMGLGLGLNRLVAYQAVTIPFITTVVPAPEPTSLPPTTLPTSTMQATPTATETPVPTIAVEGPSGNAPVPLQAASAVPTELPTSTMAPQMLPATATVPVVATAPILPTATVEVLPSATVVLVPTLPPPTLTPTVTIEPTLPPDMPTSTPDNGDAPGNGNGNGNNGNGNGNGGGNGNGNNGNGNGNGGGNGNGNNGNGNNGNGGGNGNGNNGNSNGGGNGNGNE